MSTSLNKRKLQLQKQNINRLSNSKIMSAYSGTNLTKINCGQLVQPFLSINLEEKLKTNTKRTARLKTGRKHQMSVQFMLSSKIKEPYAIKNSHQESKMKQKKKKKDKNSHQSSKFLVPMAEFSKSNSLIVFSEKDSTISTNLLNKEKHQFYSHKYTPSQAAVLIQKTWRGYLTRKLLDQYITDEQSKLNSVMKKIRSKQESFILNEDREEELHFSQFSSINQGTANMNELRKFSHQNDEYETNAKYYPLYTSQQTSTKEQLKADSPIQLKSFFKNHKTQTDVGEEKQKSKTNLSLASSLYNYSFTSKYQDQKVQVFLQNQSLKDKINRINSSIQIAYKDCRKQLKENLQRNNLDLQQMIARNTKIKEIYENSKIFLQDVLSQITAIIEDIQDVTQNGVGDSIDQSQNKNEPKSQLFTIEMDENEPQLHVNNYNFKDGQLKLQSYLNDLIEEYNRKNNGISQLEFLCQILKANSEKGVKNIVERCLLQFTVEIITQNFPLEQLNSLVYKAQLGESKEQQFIKKWIEEINKWDLGTIHQVTQAMESSSFMIGQTSKSFIYSEK